MSTTRIQTSSTAQITGGGLATVPFTVENSRTGELLEVVAYGDDWLEVVRPEPASADRPRAA